MLRRFFSHVLISLATFALTATLFIWTIDGRVLNPSALSGELRKAGVGQEIATLLPDVLTADPDMPEDEKQRVREVVSDAVTAEYVDEKIEEASYAVLDYIHGDSEEAVIDLTDFSERLKEALPEEANELDDGDTPLAEPIDLNEDGQMDNLRSAYGVFSTVKLAGVLIFALLLLLEWYVATKGEKLRRISRVFLYAGLSYAAYWILLILAPRLLGDSLSNNVEAEFDASGVIDAVVRAVQGLFSFYFLAFALFSLGIATVLYVIRHYRHGDVGKDPTPKKPSR